jgi:predicted acetylornithine/succinylornithine family transaminase
MNSQEVFDLDKKYVFPTYDRFPVVFTHGRGAELYDAGGKRYLDFLGGIAVNALGHAHPRMVRAIASQAGKVLHTSNLFHNEHQAALAGRLSGLCGMDAAFFCNSGTEANEAAIKIARRYAFLKTGGREKNAIVALHGSFHGRSTGALAITGQEKLRTPFEPLLPGARFVSPGDAAALEKAVGPDTCAVFIEPVLGEGGVRIVPKPFLEEARRLCDLHDALLVFDEVQCGIGRTGRFCAWEHSGVKPDVVTLAKPLGLGIPMGAMLGVEKTRAAFSAGTHGSTFGGGPLACALSLELLSILDDEDLLTRAQKAGSRLMDGLRTLAGKKPVIKEVRGLGLMIGAEISVPGKPVVGEMLKRGYIINCTHDTVLRFLPPFVVSDMEIDEVLSALSSVLADAAAEPKKEGAN